MLVDSEFELNKKNNETLEKLIYQDQLTGLYNRKKLMEFEESLTEENEKYGILIIDIDDFKSINDRYGHQVGDEFLIVVAGILDELCRYASLFRYAGDEFVVVSMNATEEEFQQLLFEIREELSKVELLKKGNSINVSGGIAISHNDERFEEIFRRADCSMYENKITKKSKCRINSRKKNSSEKSDVDYKVETGV